MRHMLLNKWKIYENYQQQDAKTQYKDLLQEVCEFSSMEETAFIFKRTMYSRPSSIFTDVHENKLRVFTRFNSDANGQEVLIAGISVFKDGINPSWEDEHNKDGSELQLEVRLEDYEKIDQFYQDLFLSVVGQNEPSTNRINGFRIVDKLTGRGLQHVRIEVWLDFDIRRQEHSLAKQQIEKVIIDSIKRTINSESLSFKYLPHSK